MGLSAREMTRERTLDLDALAVMGPDELATLFGAGSVPDHIGALDGDLTGRMLAVRYTRPAAGLLRRTASGDGFPWGGKSFQSSGPRAGSGINRVLLWGRHRLFPFTTDVRPSVVDGRDCVFLQYDHPDNPSFIRHIHDEVREIEPGLFLGPAMWKAETGGPRHVLWFALDAGVG